MIVKQQITPTTTTTTTIAETNQEIEENTTTSEVIIGDQIHKNNDDNYKTNITETTTLSNIKYNQDENDNHNHNPDHNHEICQQLQQQQERKQHQLGSTNSNINNRITLESNSSLITNKLTDLELDQLKSLFKIIRQGDYKDFIELLESGGFKNLLNVFIEGQTALHYSLIYGRSLAWCKQLVLNGANPNLTNLAGWHPIHLAAFNGSRETMRYLIDCIAC